MFLRPVVGLYRNERFSVSTNSMHLSKKHTINALLNIYSYSWGLFRVCIPRPMYECMLTPLPFWFNGWPHAAVSIAPAVTHRATFVGMSRLHLIPSPCKSESTFLASVAASFNIVAVQGEGEEEKAIHSPGVEGLHVLLEGCRGEAPRCGVSAFDVSVDSVKKVFMDKEWLLDRSFRWA